MSRDESSNPLADAAMDRYANGDDAAFADLYDALAPRLVPFLTRKVSDRAVAADLLQEIMLRIHCARARFVRGSWVSPWAFAIARHLLVSRLRRKAVEQALPGNEAFGFVSEAARPDDIAAYRERTVLLFDQVAQLPPAQREAFELVYYGEMSHAEAAQTLGVSVASVKLRVHRANETLRSTEPGLNGKPCPSPR